jgi:hypothetical protein
VIDFVLIEQKLNEYFYPHQIQINWAYYVVLYHVTVIVDKVPGLCFDFLPLEIINEDDPQAVVTDCLACHTGEVIAMRKARDQRYWPPHLLN